MDLLIILVIWTSRCLLNFEANLKQKIMKTAEKTDAECNQVVTKVNTTLDDIGRLMKQSVGILANILRPRVASYSQQMPQGPCIS